MTCLELGRFSRFLLGEKIVLQVNPGYWVEGGFDPEYSDDMPLLEAELLYEDNGGEIALAWAKSGVTGPTPGGTERKGKKRRRDSQTGDSAGLAVSLCPRHSSELRSPFFHF